MMNRDPALRVSCESLCSMDVFKTAQSEDPQERLSEDDCPRVSEVIFFREKAERVSFIFIHLIYSFFLTFHQLIILYFRIGTIYAFNMQVGRRSMMQSGPSRESLASRDSMRDSAYEETGERTFRLNRMELARDSEDDIEFEKPWYKKVMNKVIFEK